MDDNDNNARPDFPNTPGGQMLAMAYDAHIAYEAAYEAAFGTTSMGRKVWEASLDLVELDDATTFTDLDEYANYSEEASQVLAVLRFAEQLVKDAKANLAGLYYGTKKSAISNDATDIASLRASVDNFLTVTLGMVDVGLLTLDDIWSVIPSTDRKVRNGGGKTRKVYGGPSLPTTRKVSPLRANAKEWQLQRKVSEPGEIEVWAPVASGNLAEQAKVGLHLTMAELREIVGEFSRETPGEYTTPSGVLFRIAEVSK